MHDNFIGLRGWGGGLFGGTDWSAGQPNEIYNNDTGIVAVRGFVAELEPFTRSVTETGVLVGNKEALIAAEVGGQVLEIKVEIGDKVRAGDPLVRLDDELYNLEAARAQIAYDKAKLDLDRMGKLFAQNSISSSELENARLGAKGAEVQYRLAQKTYLDATIRAPFPGTIAQKLTEVGQMVERGMPVVQLVDLNSLKLTVQVSEANIKYFSAEASATIIVEAVGDTVAGKVTSVGSRAESGSRTFPVEIKLPGSERLRSGMFARALVASSLTQPAILVPRVALLPEAGNTVVFVARGKSAEKKLVRPIGISGDRLAVEGLASGDTVITTGNQTIVQGTPIHLVLEERTQP